VRIKGENDVKYVEKYLAPSDTQQRLDALASESGDNFLSTNSRKTTIPLCGSFQFSECLHAHCYLTHCEVLGSRELCMFRSLCFICLLIHCFVHLCTDPFTKHLLCTYGLFYNWKFNVELYLNASESTFLTGSWWSWDRDMWTPGAMIMCYGCPVEEMICFLEEGIFELSLVGSS